jgi:hypothetical protein
VRVAALAYSRTSHGGLGPTSEGAGSSRRRAGQSTTAAMTARKSLPSPRPHQSLSQRESAGRASIRGRRRGGGGLGGRGDGGFGRDGSVGASVTMRFSCFPSG